MNKFTLLASSVALSLTFSAYSAENNSKKNELSTLEMFVSPISIGGKWGGNVSWGNLKRAVMGKMETKLCTPELEVNEALINRYVDEVAVPTDPEIVSLNTDPNPDPDYHKKLADLKATKRVVYLAKFRQMYNLKDPVEAAKPNATVAGTTSGTTAGTMPSVLAPQKEMPPMMAMFSSNSKPGTVETQQPGESRVTAIIASTRVEVKPTKEEQKRNRTSK